MDSKKKALNADVVSAHTRIEGKKCFGRTA
jgi:hypothetical protein